MVPWLPPGLTLAVEANWGMNQQKGDLTPTSCNYAFQVSKVTL